MDIDRIGVTRVVHHHGVGERITGQGGDMLCHDTLGDAEFRHPHREDCLCRACPGIVGGEGHGIGDAPAVDARVHIHRGGEYEGPLARQVSRPGDDAFLELGTILQDPASEGDLTWQDIAQVQVERRGFTRVVERQGVGHHIPEVERYGGIHALGDGHMRGVCQCEGHLSAAASGIGCGISHRIGDGFSIQVRNPDR